MKLLGGYVMSTKGYIRVREELALSDIVKILKRRFKTFLLIFVGTIALTLCYLYLVASPLYEASAKIKVPTPSGGLNLSTAQILLGAGVTTSPDVVTHQEIMLSRPVLEEVVRRVGLVNIENKKRKNVTVEQVINTLKNEKVISITSIKNTPILQIKVYNTDRNIAKRILEELINAYVSSYIRINKDEKNAQTEILERKIPELEKEIAEIGEKIKNFKLTKSVSPSQEGELYISAIATLSKEAYETENEIQSTKEAISRIESQLSLLQTDRKRIGYTPTSDLLEKYRADLAKLQAEYSSLIQVYTEEHPNIKAIKAQIKELEEQIEKEIKRITNSRVESPSPLLQELYSQLIQNRLKLSILEAKLSTLRSSIQDVEKKLKKLPLIEQEYLNLERDYKVKQNLYTVLVQKYEELKLSAASMETNTPQIIDPPHVPDVPSKPEKKLTLGIGGVTGLFLGIISVFLREVTDRKIRTVDELQELVRVPVLVNAKDDQKRAVKTILSHIFVNYPSHKLVLVSSPDDIQSVDNAYRIICEVLEEASINFDTVDLWREESLKLVQTLENAIEEKLSKNEYLIIKAPDFKSSYDSMIVSKKVHGLILTLRLNSSGKSELVRTLALLEENNIELYGILVM